MNKTREKYLIFDLGGVIINLNTELTIRAFAEITGKSPGFIIDFSASHSIFHAYERGEVKSAEFRDVVRSITDNILDDATIDQAWNAMILDLPKSRIDLLSSLKEDFEIYLLSNTNFIHMKRVNEVLEAGGLSSFDSLFKKDYYSHLMGKRKPDAEIFEQVLEENNLDPASTIFFDDNKENITAASHLGIQTLHVTSPQVMMDYFNGR